MSERSPETRNSPLRQLVERPMNGLTVLFHERFPNVTPNDITHTGTALEVVGVGVAAYLQTHQERVEGIKRALVCGLSIGLPQVTDMVDGSLARTIRRVDPKRATDPLKGALADYRADRWQELAQGLGRAYVAFNRGSKWGEFAAYAALITNPLTSFTRALAEKQGFVVPEFGIGLESAGNRVGRAVTGTLGSSFPAIQPGLDTVSTMANIKSSATRLSIAYDDVPGVQPVTDPEKLAYQQELADLKIKDSQKFLALGVVSAAALAILLRSRK